MKTVVRSTPAPSHRGMVHPALRPFVLAIGILSFIIGVIAIFIPLLPTTPFVILSAYLFSKSSPWFHARLLHLPYVGPAVRDWERFGVISVRAKWMATLVLGFAISIPLISIALPLPVQIAIVAVAGGIVTFVHSRPSIRQDR